MNKQKSHTNHIQCFAKELCCDVQQAVDYQLVSTFNGYVFHECDANLLHISCLSKQLIIQTVKHRFSFSIER